MCWSAWCQHVGKYYKINILYFFFPWKKIVTKWRENQNQQILIQYQHLALRQTVVLNLSASPVSTNSKNSQSIIRVANTEAQTMNWTALHPQTHRTVIRHNNKTIWLILCCIERTSVSVLPSGLCIRFIPLFLQTVCKLYKTETWVCCAGYGSQQHLQARAVDSQLQF